MQNLPNFIIGGAAKCGTTSLYAYLERHPSVFLSPIKEPKYFACAGAWREECIHSYSGEVFRQYITDFEEYQRQFDSSGEATAIGEASPQYLVWPDSAQLIAQTIPDVKLVFILREPVERLVSDYRFRLNLGLEENDLSKVIREDVNGTRDQWRGGRIVEIGFYAKHLKRFYDYFREDQIRVFLYDDLKDQTLQVVREICEFIGVDQSIDFGDLRPQNVGKKVKQPKNKLSRIILDLLLSNSISLFRAIVPSSLKRLAYSKLVSNDVVLTEIDRAYLRRLYESDIKELEVLIGRDLAHWRAK